MIIVDQVQESIQKNGDALLEWISTMKIDDDPEILRRVKLSMLKKINIYIEQICFSLHKIGYMILQGMTILL